MPPLSRDHTHDNYAHKMAMSFLAHSLVSAEDQSSPQPQRESPQYRAVLQYKDQLARSLANGPDQHLLNQFKIRGWLGPGADVSAPEMIDEALTRIRSDVSNYEIFIGMLSDHSRVKDIVDAITGMVLHQTNSLDELFEFLLLLQKSILCPVQ